MSSGPCQAVESKHQSWEAKLGKAEPTMQPGTVKHLGWVRLSKKDLAGGNTTSCQASERGDRTHGPVSKWRKRAVSARELVLIVKGNLSS